MPSLKQFLSQRTANKDSANLLDMKGGTYHVSEEEFEEFLKVYASCYENEEPALCERRRENFVFCLDLDFGDEDEYDKIQVIKDINTFLSDRDPREQKITYYAIYATTEAQDKYHILYPQPGMYIDYDASTELLADIVKYLTALYPTVVKPWDQVVDPLMNYSPLRMIGSVKMDKGKCLGRVYYPCTIDFETLCVEDMKTEITVDDLKKYSMYLNSHGALVTGKKKVVKKHAQPAAAAAAPTTVVHNTDTDIYKIIDALNPIRAHAYDSWTTGVWAIYNYCHDNNMQSRDYIHQFSRKDEVKYSAHDVDRFIDTIQYKADGANIGTLLFWLREDNPEMFKQLTYKQQTALLYKAVSKTHFDVAKLVYHMLKDEFVYSNEKWYVFKNHRWQTKEIALTLGLRISCDVYKAVMKHISYLSLRITEEQLNEQKQKTLQNQLKEFNDLASKLKNKPFKDCVIAECRALFQDDEFAKKLDTRLNLVGFDNGVYDLDKGEFRDGRPDDWLSMTCGYNYNANVEQKYKDEVEKCIREMMPNDDMYKYVMRTLAYGLHGYKSKEFFQIWTGMGGNGKSLLASLIRVALGEYYYEPSIKMYTTTPKTSSNANPEVAALKGRRIIVSSEPGCSETIKNDFIKALTGGDLLQGRELYQKTFVEFKPQCLPIILCNEIPNCDSFDGGLARRIKIVNFPFQFKANPIGNQKLCDETLKGKFENDENYRQAFMGLLVDEYATYVTSNSAINDPPEVVEFTQRYLEEVNVIKAVLDNHFVITYDNKDMVRSSDFHACFEQHHSDHPRVKDKKWVKSQMKQNGFESKKKTTRGMYYTDMVYFGIRFKTGGDNEEEASDAESDL